MSDLAPLVPMISREGYLFAFPNAPIPMDFGLGMVGYAWSAPLDADFDEDGRAESLLEAFVDDVTTRYGIEEGRVVLGGFSQGGMMAFRHGLRHADRFPGIVALSSRLPSQDRPRDAWEAGHTTSAYSSPTGPSTMSFSIQEGRSAHDVLSRRWLSGRVPRVQHGPPDHSRGHRRPVRLARGNPANPVLNPSSGPFQSRHRRG